MSTVFATVSTPGPPGPQGPPGRSPIYIVAAGAPAAGTGQNGDMYIDSATGNLYGPKSAGAWGVPVANIKGPTGSTGAPGYSPQYIVQAGTPSPAAGNTGDMYINSSNDDLYGPKSAVGWGSPVANLRGATGATGAQGPPGVAYTPRGQWVSTTTYLQGDEVTDVSQLYISLQGGNLNHVPASNPTWWQLVGSGASQSPWLSNINGGGFQLFNTSRIGVGTLTPADQISVYASGSVPFVTVTGEWNVASMNVQYRGISYSGTNPNLGLLVSGIAYRGTVAAPTAIQANDGLMGIWGYGYDGSSANSQGGASVRILASSNWTTTSAEGHIVFATTAPGATVVAERMRITGTGMVGIGVTNPLFPLTILATATTATLNTTVRINRSTGSSFAGISISGVLAATPCFYSPISTDDWAFGFDFGAGIVERMRITSAGMVGIGATPANALSFGNAGSDTQHTIALYENPGGGNVFGFKFAFTGPNRIACVSNGTEVMCIGTVGVGVGTNNPLVPMHIVAAGVGPKTALQLDNSDSGVTTSEARLVFAEAGGVYQGIGGPYNNGNPALTFSVTNAGGWNERMRITSQGFVGVNWATPTDWLMVRPSGGRAGITIQGKTNSPADESTLSVLHASTGYGWRARCFDTDGSFVLDTQSAGTWTLNALVVNASTRNVGLGINNPSDLLTIATIPYQGNASAGIRLQTPASEWIYRIGVKANSGGAPRFAIDTLGTECLTCTPNGIGIKLQYPLYSIDATGDCNITGSYRVNGVAISTGGGGLIGVQINSGTPTTGNFTYLNFYQLGSITLTNGGVSGPGNNTYTLQIGTSSDLRLKRNVQPLSGGLAMIAKLHPITAEWNGLADTREGTPLTSIIAQDLQGVIPNAVYTYKAKLRSGDTGATELLGYDSMAIVCHLILAVQELQQRLMVAEHKLN